MEKFKIIFIGDYSCGRYKKYKNLENVYYICAYNFENVEVTDNVLITKMLGLRCDGNYETMRDDVYQLYKTDILKILDDCKNVLFVASLGDDSDTGIYSCVLNIAHNLNINIYSIVSTPFSFEGKRRIQDAEECNNIAKKYCLFNYIIDYDEIRKKLFTDEQYKIPFIEVLESMDKYFFIEIDFFLKNMNKPKEINKENMDSLIFKQKE